MAKEITQTFLMNRTAPIRIGNELIDIYDHVNYLGYNIYFERQRYGLLLSRGITITNLRDSYNLQLVAAEQHMRWLRSAKEGDLVDIESTAYLIGSRKMRFKQIMKSGAKVLVESDLSGYFLNAKLARSLLKLIQN